jgi:cell division protein FtsW
MVLSAGSVSAAQGYGGNSFWYFQRQVLYAAVGIGAAVLVARLSPRIWKHLGIWILGGATVLMAIAARPTSGTSLYGASRWIDLGPVTIQPSEFAKLGLVGRRGDDPHQ